MTLLAGLGISATGALVVFGALTGRLAAILAAVAKPSDLASSGSYVNGVSDSGINAARSPDASANLLTVLVKEVRLFGANKDPAWTSTVQPLITKAQQTRKQSDYDAAIAAVRSLIAKYKPTTPQAAPAPHGA